MKKFLVLYHSEGALSGMSVREAFANTPPEQMKAGMAAWMAWHQQCGGAVVDLGAPLDDSTTVAGGVATPGMSTITGFSMLQAGSMDEAIELMKPHPHLRVPGASVQLLELLPMPGM